MFDAKEAASHTAQTIDKGDMRLWLWPGEGGGRTFCLSFYAFFVYITGFALFTHNFSNFRQIVVMMGTVVIFFFACLLPFKVAHWYWILSYRILIILGDDVMFDDVKINFKIQLLQGADHVGCYFSVWDYGHFQHRGILQPELWNRKKKKIDCSTSWHGKVTYTCTTQVYFNLLYFSRLMFYINSAINPILYNTMSSRWAFRSIW